MTTPGDKARSVTSRSSTSKASSTARKSSTPEEADTGGENPGTTRSTPSTTRKSTGNRRSPATSVGTSNNGKCPPAPRGDDEVYEIHITPNNEKAELTKPTYLDTPAVRYTKWKIGMAYTFLTTFLVLFVGAIVGSPNTEVRFVVLGVGSAVTAALVKLLSNEYRRNV